MKGKDLTKLGDFTANVRKGVGSCLCIGACSKRTRSTNGEFLSEFITQNNFSANNITFKHRACHITWLHSTNLEQKRILPEDYRLLTFVSA